MGRVTPSNAATPLNPGLAEFRTKMGISLFPAKEVLDALCSTAASDGKLTRSVGPPKSCIPARKRDKTVARSNQVCHFWTKIKLLCFAFSLVPNLSLWSKIKTNCCENISDRCLATSLTHVVRAEFDDFLKELARLLEISAFSTANQIFEIFDEATAGVLHVKDISAGLAILCNGSLARSVRLACRLYEGADGHMGFADICDFTLSIFKVLSGCQLFPYISKRHVCAGMLLACANE